jgi:L-alanine-DL-glutamate epimerase-like enolase superfamily enzyme
LDSALDGKWTLDFVPALSNCSVQLIEQPLPADTDDALARSEHVIPLCADESCRTVGDLDRLDGKYGAITIKLDKAGGLTEALALAAEAKRRGLRIMVGGMIGTSLGIAPAPRGAEYPVTGSPARTGYGELVGMTARIRHAKGVLTRIAI